MGEIHQIVEAIQRSSSRSVLATIIHVEGSAYKKEGSIMLFLEDGTQIGVLSPGCLETDLAARVNEVLEAGVPRTYTYDMRVEDDLSWGQGAGCNGVIRVLLEPVDSRLREHLCMVQGFLDQGIPVAGIKKLTGDFSVTDFMFLTKDGQAFGKWRGEAPDVYENFLINGLPFAEKSGIRYIHELSANIYVHYFQPKPRFIIFGAGADVKPLALFAAQTGFSVVISDWRPAFCDEKHFPEADFLVLGFPAEAIEKLALTPYDFVIIMTHHFQHDKELLQAILKRDVRYVGVLGPRTRTSRLLDGDTIPEWIRSPVGLPIGAKGPEEIAISILADVIKTLRNPADAKVVSR